MGVSYKETKKEAEAIECWNKVIEIDKNNAKAYNNIGSILLDAEKFQKAIDYFNKAISFANDIEKLDTIRKNLREKTKNSPLFDAETFGNDFSKLVKEMWANYGSNKNNK